jgi:hypothetical protein
MLVHPNDALLRLKLFVEAEAGVSQPGALGTTKAAAASIAATAPTAKHAPGSKSSSSSPNAGATAAGAGLPGCFQGQVVSRRAADREREYWERLTKVVGDKVVRVWGMLEKQLGSYYKLLVQRGEGLSAISKLQQENEELRNLLNQYLGSKISSELQIPPMAVL